MNLVQQTKRCLGDYAEPLLEQGAVIPLGSNKRPVRGAKWSEPIDPNRSWRFEGLAFKTGAVSNITVIDFDAEKNPHANVLTKRGSHIYVPYEQGDRSRQYRDIKTDLRGDGGYIEFYGHGKTILDLDLRNRSDYDSLLSPSITTTRINKYESTIRATNNPYLMDSEQYKIKVESAGYKFNLEVIRNRRTGQMLRAPEGYRNMRLFKNACEFAALGIELESLSTAALENGLSPSEVITTIESAKTQGMVFDYFSAAYTWLAAAKSVWDSPVADELARETIEQHNMVPTFNQQRIAENIGMPLRTFKSHVKRYVDAEIVKRHESKGRQPNGFVWPNNFELLIGEE